MKFKRTPEPADAEVLAYAGVLGHRYAVTIDVCPRCGAFAQDETKTRRVSTETDEPDPRLMPWEKDANPRVFEQVRFRSKKGRRWRRVK